MPEGENAPVPDPEDKWETALYREQKKTWREQELVANTIWYSLSNMRDNLAELSIGLRELLEEKRKLQDYIQKTKKEWAETRSLKTH